MSSRIDESDSREETMPARIPFSDDLKFPTLGARKGLSKKIVAVILVTIVLSSAGLFVWFGDLRHWAMRDVIEEVINDPYVGTPGFSHNLAGRKVVVQELESETLGTILVQCAVTDMAGSALMDEDDFFTVST